MDTLITNQIQTKVSQQIAPPTNIQNHLKAMVTNLYMKITI